MEHISRAINRLGQLSGLIGALLLAGGFIVAAVGINHGPARQILPPERGPVTVTVSSTDEALTIIKEARGHLTIRLRPGSYAEPLIRARSASGQLIIESASREDPAVLSGLGLKGASHVLIRDVVIKSPLFFSSTKPLVFIKESHDIRFDRVKLIGEASPRGFALTIRQSNRVSVTNSAISGFRYGISLVRSRALRLERNEIHHIGIDAIRGGGASNVLIQGNIIGDILSAPGDHPDGIQLWSKGETAAAQDIVIRNNMIARGGGRASQGIFIRDNLTKLPFRNVEVSGNLVLGSMYHGISLNGVANAKLSGNEVLAFPDHKSWILIIRGKNVGLIHNRASKFVIIDSEAVWQDSNKTNSPAKKKLRSKVEAWLQSKSMPPAARGPYLKSLLNNLAD